MPKGAVRIMSVVILDFGIAEPKWRRRGMGTRGERAGEHG